MLLKILPTHFTVILYQLWYFVTKSNVITIHKQVNDKYFDLPVLFPYPHTNRRRIDITTYQIRKIKADTSLCLFADEMRELQKLSIINHG